MILLSAMPFYIAGGRIGFPAANDPVDRPGSVEHAAELSSA